MFWPGAEYRNEGRPARRGALAAGPNDEPAARRNPSRRRRHERPRRLAPLRQRRQAEPVYSAWWGGRLPGRPVVGTCYRLTKGAAITEDDCKSNWDLGKPRRLRERWDEDEYRSVSVYSNPRDAADALQRFPQTGRFAARLLITRGAPITGKWAPTRHRSHWNLWGAPAELRACVREEGLTADQLDALARRA